MSCCFRRTRTERLAMIKRFARDGVTAGEFLEVMQADGPIAGTRRFAPGEMQCVSALVSGIFYLHSY